MRLIPRVSSLTLYPTNQPSYGFWTKVENKGRVVCSEIAEYTSGRVVIGWAYIYFENAQDATFFKLSNREIA